MVSLGLLLELLEVNRNLGSTNSSDCSAPRAGANRPAKAPARCQPRTVSSFLSLSPRGENSLVAVGKLLEWRITMILVAAEMISVYKTVLVYAPRLSTQAGFREILRVGAYLSIVQAAYSRSNATAGER